jgi:diguanylate cyclase (GGDEF)-like protein/PAS domain S-box-containing protein
MIFILVVSIALQLIAAVRVGRYPVIPEEKWKWSLFIAGLVVAISLDCLVLYLGENGLLIPPVDMFIGGVCLGKSLMIVASVFWLLPRLGAITRWGKIHKARSERFRAIFDHLPQIAAMKDRSGAYTLVNLAFMRFLDKKAVDITGKTDNDLFSPAEAARLQHEEQSVIQSGAASVQEIELTGAEGARWLQMMRVPINNEDSICEGMIVSAIDIGEAKQFEDAWLHASDEKAKINETLQRQLRIERLAVVIATHFIQIGPDKVDSEIAHALQAIAEQAAADDAFILILAEDGKSVEIPYEWRRAEAQISAELVSRMTLSGSSWWSETTKRFDALFIQHSKENDPELMEAVEYLRRINIKTFTGIPITSGRSLIGYLGFAACRELPHWREMQGLFKVFAEMFVNILERKWDTEKISQTGKKLNAWIARLEQHNHEASLVSEMENLLLVCRTMEEAYPIIDRYGKRLFPTLAGALYIIRQADQPAERTVCWGQKPPAENELAINECWGLRRGKVHLVSDAASGPHCLHLGSPKPAAYMCIPLLAQGEALGLLHLRCEPEGSGPQTVPEPAQRLAESVAEYIALALANLSLKNELLVQAIRDPLTNLFNRRYMEETLEREVHRAKRHNTAVGLMMFDIDDFKTTNDTHGHEAGDAVLKCLGELLLSSFRDEDIPCRYGGDEFTVILPESSLADTWQRAEQLRVNWKNHNFKYEGDLLPLPTLSIGVAAYPEHGQKPEQLLQTADTAAYAAKSKGKDRVILGSSQETPNP